MRRRNRRLKTANAQFTARLSNVNQRLNAIKSENSKNPFITNLEEVENYQGMSQNYIRRSTAASGASKILQPIAYRVFLGLVDEFLLNNLELLWNKLPNDASFPLVPLAISHYIMSFIRIAMRSQYVMPNPMMNCSLKFDMDLRALSQKEHCMAITAGQKDIFIDNRLNTQGAGKNPGFDGKPNLEHCISRFRALNYEVQDLNQVIQRFKMKEIKADEMEEELLNYPILSRIFLEYDYFYQKDVDGKEEEVEDEDDDIEVECAVMEAVRIAGALKYDSRLKMVTHDAHFSVLAADSMILPGVI